MFCSGCFETSQFWSKKRIRVFLMMRDVPPNICATEGIFLNILNEPRHDKTSKVSVRPAKTQISLGIRMPSLIRVFAVRMKKSWVISYTLSAQRRLWSDWAIAQTDLSLRWTHTYFVCFVMSWLKLLLFVFKIEKLINIKWIKTMK